MPFKNKSAAAVALAGVATLALVWLGNVALAAPADRRANDTVPGTAPAGTIVYMPAIFKSP